jgi:hypothetical protein
MRTDEYHKANTYTSANFRCERNKEIAKIQHTTEEHAVQNLSH